MNENKKGKWHTGGLIILGIIILIVIFSALLFYQDKPEVVLEEEVPIENVVEYEVIEGRDKG